MILALADGARLISKRNHLAVAEGGRETWVLAFENAFSHEALLQLADGLSR